MVKAFQLPDSSFITISSHNKFPPINDINARLAKIDPTGHILWIRDYGDSFDQYGYELTTLPDGGFMIGGRSDTITHANAYLIRTNCMGLLTEPEAFFEYEVTEETGAEGEPVYTVQFTNQSQYIYPDSIDGGHYFWDFGDGFVSEELEPQHLYETSGTYEVSLYGVVCGDTSVYSQILSLFPLGATAGFTSPEDAPYFRLSPNPAGTHTRLTYQLPEGQSAHLVLYDRMGRLAAAYNDLSGTGHLLLDLRALPSGLYYCSVASDGKVFWEDKLVLMK